MSFRASSSSTSVGRDTLRQLLDDVDRLKRLSAAIVPGGGVPSGAIVQYGGAAAPGGWLICDGSSVLRSDYPDLYAAIGVAYGSVDGTHFTLPDGRGRVLTGKGTNANVNTLAQNEGAAVGNRQTRHFHSASGLGFSGSTSTTGTENQSHTHNDGGHSHNIQVWNGNFDGGFPVTAEGNQLTSDNNYPTDPGYANIGTEVALHNHGFTPAGSVTGNVGVTSAASQDTLAYLVVNHIIKT